MKISFVLKTISLLLVILLPGILQGMVYAKTAEKATDPFERSGYLIKAYHLNPWNSGLVDKAVTTLVNRPARLVAILEPLYLKNKLPQKNLVILARSFSRMNEHEKALVTYQRLFNKGDHLGESCIFIANHWISQGDLGMARQILETGLIELPDDPELNLKYGLLLAAMDDRSGIEPLLVSLKSDRDKNDSIILELANVLSLENSSQRSVSVGVDLLKLGEINLAEVAFNRATDQGPKDAITWAWLGLTQAMIPDGDPDPSLEMANHYSKVDPVLYNVLGQAYNLAGFPIKAENYFLKAVEITPEDPYLWMSLGSLAQASDIYQSLGYFVKAVNLTPQDPVVWKSLLRFCVETNTYLKDYGQTAINKLETITPMDPDLEYFRGRYQMALGEYGRSEISLKSALESNQNLPLKQDILFYLGLLSIKQQRFLIAESYLNQLVEEYPKGEYFDESITLLETSINTSDQLK